MDLEQVLKIIEDSKIAEDLFGNTTTQADITAMFRRMARVIHPDRHPGVIRANDAMRKLTELKEAAERKLEAGTYGDRKPAPAPTAPAVHVPTVVKMGKKEYRVESLLAQGDVADLYTAAADGMRPVCFKLGRAAGDNDLLENEQKQLKQLDLMNAAQKSAKLLPELVDTFMLRSSSGSQRRVNIITLHRDYYSLVEVKRHHPELDVRDAVWMFKRILMGLGLVSRKGLVHGAVLPAHVLVHPIEHGMKLVDWKYAVERGQHVRAISKMHREFYPPEVLAKQPALAETDIYMAAKTMVWLLNGDLKTNVLPHRVPAPISGFLNGCMLQSAAKRPGDAWSLHEEFNELLRKLFGPPKYRKLAMPARETADGRI